jgi:molecular chaperone DnaK
MESYALGIDLGTTNSVAAYFVNNSPVVIPDKSGNYLTPSVVNLGQNNAYTVGETARSLFLSDPTNTFLLIKRLIGLDPRSSKGDTNDLIASLQFSVAEEEDRFVLKSTKTSRLIDCQEISARILMHLYESAQRYSPEISRDCVVTVPAYFNNRQRVATKDAVEIAGLNLLQLINEPTAAAIAYGLHTKANQASTVLVVDLGGGTFDISLVEKDEDDLFFVVATFGDSHLGGEDFTRLIADFLIAEAKLTISNLVADDTKVIAQFREQAERAKCTLSFDAETYIEVPFLPTTDGKHCEFGITLTQDQMAEICSPLVCRVKSCLDEFIKKEEVKGIVIDDVVLAGGASRLPLFQAAVHEATGLEPKSHLNPDLLIAQGAAICADMHRQGQPIQSLMSDVTPLTLGTDIIGDEFVKIIPANTSIPCSRTERFTTVEDYQESVFVDVYQGERIVASENINLGSFRLDGIEIAKAGLPNLDITYTIDIDGILSVSCIDLATQAARQITIQNSGALSRKQINAIKELALASHEKDLQVLRSNKEVRAQHDRLQELVRLAEKKLKYADMSELQNKAYESAISALGMRDVSFLDSDACVTLKDYLDSPSKSI